MDRGALPGHGCLGARGGQTVPGGRRFFLGVIIGESLTIGGSTLMSLLTDVGTGPIFLPS